MIQGTPNRFTWRFSNMGAPSSNMGASVVPGASNVEGSWTAIASAAQITQDVYAMVVWVSGGNSANTQKDHLLDIGVDPAGGTAYAEVIANIVCGQSGGGQNCGNWYYFPLFIRAGSSVAARIQGSNATAGTVRVAVTFYGMPTRPESIRAGVYSETIGAITNSGGVSFTPGNAQEGAWTSLGTTAKALWWWQLAVQISNGTTTSLYTYIDLAWGDASNKHLIIEDQPLCLPGSQEFVNFPITVLNCVCDVPAGATIYVRGHSSGAPASGWNAVAIGVGG